MDYLNSVNESLEVLRDVVVMYIQRWRILRFRCPREPFSVLIVNLLALMRVRVANFRRAMSCSMAQNDAVKGSRD
jgi:hypothetical protein